MTAAASVEPQAKWRDGWPRRCDNASSRPAHRTPAPQHTSNNHNNYDYNCIKNTYNNTSIRSRTQQARQTHADTNPQQHRQPSMFEIPLPDGAMDACPRKPPSLRRCLSPVANLCRAVWQPTDRLEEEAQSVSLPALQHAGVCASRDGPVLIQPVKASRQKQTLVIFDWDDTLLPTSLLYSSGRPAAVDDTKMRALEEAGLRLLGEVVQRPHTTVAIVTNGSAGWVETSGARHLPKLLAFLVTYNVRIVSARAEYQRAHRPNPAASKQSYLPGGGCFRKRPTEGGGELGTPGGWKSWAFKRELVEQLVYADGCGGRLELISVGDAEYERAAAHCCAGLVTRVKTVKLETDPLSCAHLAAELDATRAAWQALCACSGSVDMEARRHPFGGSSSVVLLPKRTRPATAAPASSAAGRHPPSAAVRWQVAAVAVLGSVDGWCRLSSASPSCGGAVRPPSSSSLPMGLPMGMPKPSGKGHTLVHRSGIHRPRRSAVSLQQPGLADCSELVDPRLLAYT